MSGVMADCTICATVRKLFRPLESHGLITSVSPTFSIAKGYPSSERPEAGGQALREADPCAIDD